MNQELYEKAYIQPALRASPNAQLDPPFPPVRVLKKNK